MSGVTCAAVIFLVSLLPVCASPSLRMDYLNPRLPIEKRIDVLMKQMTVEEKAN